jgi:hypothetical protein
MAASAILLVDAAYDSSAALKLSQRHPYGLALLDYKMQGMDRVVLYGQPGECRVSNVRRCGH